MADEFSRTALLIGDAGLQVLKGKSILVLGVGGVGSHCIEALARCGIGRIILVDPDRVELSNLNRQSVASHSTIGQYKVDVMRQRINDICPEIEVQTYRLFLQEDNLETVFQEQPDYIVDAIDTVSTKVAVAELAAHAGIPLISCMGTGNKLHPEQFQIADLSETSVCPLCKVMRRELKKRGIQHLKVLYSQEEPIHTGTRTPGSISFVPPVAGLMIAGEVIRDLLNEEDSNGSV